MFAKDLTGCFSHCCVEGGNHWIHVCIFIVHDGERCKLPAYHSLEGFQHIEVFQLFEIKLESSVFFDCWFFSGEGGRSPLASRDHFQCLLPGNFVFWHCSILVGSLIRSVINQFDWLIDWSHFVLSSFIFSHQKMPWLLNRLKAFKKRVKQEKANAVTTFCPWCYQLSGNCTDK